MSKSHLAEEYKKSIVHLYMRGKTIDEIANEYGIAKATFYRLLKRYREIKLSEDEVLTADDICNLQKKVSTLEEENLILKKAIKIFTKDLRTELPPLDD